MDTLCVRFILICAIIVATTASTTVITIAVSTTPTSPTQVSGITSESSTLSTTPVSVSTISNGVNNSKTTPTVSNGITSVLPGTTPESSLAPTSPGQSTLVSGTTDSSRYSTTSAVSSSSKELNSTIPPSSTLRTASDYSGITDVPSATTSNTLSFQTTDFASSIVTSTPSSSLTSTTTSPPTSFAFTTTEIPTTTTSKVSSIPTTFFASSILTPISQLTSTTTSPPTSSPLPNTISFESSTSTTSKTTDFISDSTTVSSSSEVFNSTTPPSSTLTTDEVFTTSTPLDTTTTTATSTTSALPTFPDTTQTSKTQSSSTSSTVDFSLNTSISSLTSTTTSPPTSSTLTTTISFESWTPTTSKRTDITSDSTTIFSSSEVFNSTTPPSSTLTTDEIYTASTPLNTTTATATSAFPTTMLDTTQTSETQSSSTSTTVDFSLNTSISSLTSTTSSPPTASTLTRTISFESWTPTTSKTTDFTSDSTTVFSSSEVFNFTTPPTSTLTTDEVYTTSTPLETTATTATSAFPTTMSDTTQTFETQSSSTSTTVDVSLNTSISSLTSTTTSPPTSSTLTRTISFESSTSTTSKTTDFTSDSTTVFSSSEVFNFTTPPTSTLTTEEVYTTSTPLDTTTTTTTSFIPTTYPDTTQPLETQSSSTSLKTSTTSTTERHTTPIRDCGEPPTLENGNVHKNGSVATYYCKPGYLGGNVSIRCLASGSWEHLSVTCSPVDCGVLSKYSNASISYFPKNTSHYGTVAVLRCDTGYTISNTNKSTTFRCNEDATWNGNLSVSCKPINCMKLDPPANGILSQYNTTVNSLVIYMCNDGYTLKGFQSRVCLDSGEWSRRPPTCDKDPEKPVKPCPNNTDSRNFHWNETKAGQSLSKPCSLHNKDLSGEITRNCTSEGMWLLPNYNCTRKAVEDIKNVVNEIKEKPSESTVEDVLGSLSNLTNQATNETTYAGEIQAITESLQVIADINYTNINLSEKQSKAFLETTSNLLDPSNAESWQSIDQESGDKEEVSGASKMLNVVSKYTDAISNSLGDSEPNRTISTANLILEVGRLNNSEDITFPDENDNASLSSSLVLSKNALKGSTKYSAVIYKNLTGVLSTKASSNSEDLELGSSVMSVKLDNWHNVDFKIKMTFENFKQNDLEPRCSFRNESRNFWETTGCERKSFNSSTTTCECDHLTNFAILMSPWTEENVETKAIRIVSIIGCSVSVVCLLLTMLAHICYWRYVKSDRVKILMNLCIALLISYGLFLGGVDRTSNKDVCTTMAVLLQYIYLVVFFLMLAEGIEISFVVLYVFLTKSRLKWILPCAWFIPALIVGISLAVTQTKGYGNSEFCWLSVDNGLIWAFVGPALLIILVNFVLLLLIFKTIFKTKNLAQKSNKQRAMAGIRCLCVLLPLVGCTWVIGIFYVNESMAWIQYVFAVCNSLQGLAIFIFHCALNTQLKQAFQRRRRLSESASYTRSTSNALKLIPRAKMSQTASDLYCSIGTETPFQRSVSSFEAYKY